MKTTELGLLDNGKHICTTCEYDKICMCTFKACGYFNGYQMYEAKKEIDKLFKDKK